MMKKKSHFEENENIKIDPNLKDHPNLFPRKMAIATAILEKYTLSQKNKRKQPQFTPLQRDLFNLFAFEPTEKQMNQLSVFLHYQYIDEIYKEPKQEVGIQEKRQTKKREQLPLILTSLQKELLNFYSREPTEQQTLQLKAFLHKLLGDEPNKSNAQQEEKIAA